jgi:hypothetical protein
MDEESQEERQLEDTHGFETSFVFMEDGRR